MADEPDKEMSFEAAVAQIDAIIKRIQAGKSLDSLVEDVRQAKELIKVCEDRILWTEAELSRMLGDGSESEHSTIE